MIKFNQISSEIIYSNPYWDYIKDKYVIPNGNEGDYFFVRTSGSVMVIPRTKDDKFVLVKQYRYLNKKFSLEFPGGGIKKTLGEFESAKAELREESGILAQSLKKIGVFNPFNGVTDEICNVYLAEELDFVNADPDSTEEFDIFKMDYEQINELIKTNEIWDGMTLSAWSMYYFSNIWSKQNDI